MVVLFVKKFLEYRSCVIARLKALKAAKQFNTQEYSLLVQTVTRLNQMRDYLVSGDWARKTVRDKFVFWVQSNYNYTLTATKYKSSENSLRVTISRADAVLSKIMSKPLEQIANGNVNDGWIEFNFNINKLDLCELFGRPVLMATPKPTDLEMCFSLEDCKAEIRFLRAHNSYAIRKEMESLDQQKLGYLLALGAVNDPAYLDERKRFIKSILKLNQNDNK